MTSKQMEAFKVSEEKPEDGRHVRAAPSANAGRQSDGAWPATPASATAA